MPQCFPGWHFRCSARPRGETPMRWTDRSLLAIRIVAQILGLWVILRTGEWVAARLPFPIPGNVLGMTILLVLLLLGTVRESWLTDGATLLTRYLAFFFVPIAVG